MDDIAEILRKHALWLNNEPGGKRADLRGADLQGANLRYADLRDADLRYADLDFSAWPLCCGSFGAKVDARLVWQLVAHLARVVPPVGDEDVAALMAAIQPWVNKFCEYRDDVKAV